jgi:hypothetical protein
VEADRRALRDKPRLLSPALITALVVLAYSAAAVAVFWRVWSGNPTIDTQYGPDTALNTWFLAWAPHAVLHGLNPFFTTAANAPYGVNVLSNTSELLLGLVAAPVTLVWGPIATFNVLMTLALAGSATSAYFLARRFTTWRPAAFAAGLLFGFSPYMMASSLGTHIHLTCMVLPPLILLVLHEMVVRQTWEWRRCALSLSALVIAQFFVSIEILLTTAITALVALVAASLVGRHAMSARWPYAARCALLSAVLIVVVLAYPAWFVVRGTGHISGPLQSVPQAYRADLLGPVIPDSLQRLAPFSVARRSDTFANSLVENGSYLGLPLLGLLAFGAVWLRRRPVVWVLSLSGAAVFGLSLGGELAVDHAPRIGPHGVAVGRLPLPEGLLSHVPVLNNTIPSRFSAYVALFAGLLLAVVLNALRAHWPTRPRGLIGPAVVAAACFVPLIPSVPLASIGPVGIPSYFSGNGETALRPGSVTLVLPFPSEVYPEAQLWQVAGSHPFRFALPGGYFLVAQTNQGGHVAFSRTISYTRNSQSAEVFVGLARGLVPQRTAHLKDGLLAQFRSWHLSNVVVPLDYTPNPDATVAFLQWLLGPPSVTNVGGVTAWYRMGAGSVATGVSPPASGAAEMGVFGPQFSGAMWAFGERAQR